MDKPEKILAVALKLFVTYGFHGTPTSKIAVEAGVSNGTLFHYFKTKDELVVALYIAIKERLKAYLTGKLHKTITVKERSEGLFVHSLSWAQEHKDEFFFIQQFHFSPHISLVPGDEIARQTKMHQELLQEGLKAKIFKPFPLDLIASIYASQINGTYHYLLNNELPAAKKKKLIRDAFDVTWAVLTNPEEKWIKK